MRTTHGVAGDPATDPVALSWLVTVRWTTLVAGLGAILAGESGLAARVPGVSASAALALAAASNLWLMWRVRRGRTHETTVLAGLLVCADVVLLSWLLLRSGAVLNPASVFYLVQIVVAALVLGRFWTWIVTVLSVGGYAALFLAPSDELRMAQGMHPEIATHMRGMWLAFALTALIIGLLVSRLAIAVEQRDRALTSLRDRTDRTSRLAALATAVTGAAHELSTPLATMAVAAHELERSLDHDAAHTEAREDAKLIRAEIDRCRRVLDGMAGRLAEPAGEAPRAVRLGDVIADALDHLRPADRARVIPEIDTAMSAVWPRGIVAQAIGNLLKNALQASGETATVRLEAGPAAGGRVRIAAVDQGRGMAADELSRAGEPFFTTKPPGEGIGLGLFVTRSAIEQLGGTLELASQSGRGTTASILLPGDVLGGAHG